MRRTLALAVAVSVVCVVAVVGGPAGAATVTPTRTPIKHFVTLLQENHSFDNYFGTFPGANGIPPNVCMPKAPPAPASSCVKPFAIAGHASQALADSASAFAAEYDKGKMDGFVSASSARGGGSDLAMAHYDRTTLGYYWDVANQYVLFDNYFSSARGGTLWNHMYWMTGTAGNPFAEKVPAAGFGSLPTIFDRLEAQGTSWKVYIQSYKPADTFRVSKTEPAQVLRAPVLAFSRFLDDRRLASHIVPLDQYYTDLQKGTLPAVSYVVPSGPSEHPPGNVASGEAFVGDLVTALKFSSSWSTSAFMWSYDDAGGWYDHVVPPANSGFRVPALLISPYAKRGYVDGTQLDHTSMLKFIEDNWKLAPLSTRDAKANDLLTAFDFGQTPRPPELLASEAPSPNVISGHAGIIYPAYGVAGLFGLLVIGSAAITTRRRRDELPA